MQVMHTNEVKDAGLWLTFLESRTREALKLNSAKSNFLLVSQL